ncbi:MAG TPA: hypothetical protein VGT78_09180 [Rhizomicrobium sp.]|nr:hypothetical protein [Rhizomicrobium sp.]
MTSKTEKSVSREAYAQAIREITRPMRWTYTAMWIVACLLSGFIGAFGGLRAIEILFGCFAAYFVVLLLVKWLGGIIWRVEKPHA